MGGDKKGWQIAVIAALSAAMLVLVLYGIRTHHDNGLLTGCPRGDRTLDYTGACAEVVWQSPLPLRTRVQGGQAWQHEAFDDAVKGLEKEFGFDAFEVVDPTMLADVVADFDVPYEAGGFNPAGRVKHTADPTSGRIVSCVILLSNLALADRAGMVVRHELGHVMGLAHDEDAQSLMTDQKLKPGHFYPLTDDDRDRLRALYVAPEK